MALREEVEQVLRDYFSADSRGALAVYLFGSVARGEGRADSDVDVGVLFETTPPSSLQAPQFRMEGELERLLHREVQVIALNRASPDLVHRVLRDGRLLLDRDPAARIRFEVGSRNEYFDMAPVRQLYRRYPPPSQAGSAGRRR